MISSLKESPLVSNNYTVNVVGSTMTLSKVDAALEYPRPESRTTVAHCLVLPTDVDSLKLLKAKSVADLVQRWPILPPTPLSIESPSSPRDGVQWVLLVPVAHFGAFPIPDRFKANSNGCVEVYITESRISIITKLTTAMRGSAAATVATNAATAIPSPSDPLSFRFTGVTGEGKSHMLLAAVALVREGFDLAWDTETPKLEKAIKMAVLFIPQLSLLTSLSPHGLAESVAQCLLQSPGALNMLAEDRAKWEKAMDLLRKVADVCPAVAEVVDSTTVSTTGAASTATPAEPASSTTPADSATTSALKEVSRALADLTKKVDRVREDLRELRTEIKTPVLYAHALLELTRELGMAVAIDEENVLYDTLEGMGEDGQARFQGRLNTGGAALIDAIDAKHDNTVVLSSACTPVALHKASSVHVLPVELKIRNTVLDNMTYHDVHRSLETFIRRSGGDTPALEAMYLMLRAAGCTAGVEVNAELKFDRRFFYLNETTMPPMLIPMVETASKVQQALLELARQTPVHWYRPGFQYELLLPRYIASSFAKGEAVYQRILKDPTTKTYKVNPSTPKVTGHKLKPGVGHSIADSNTTKDDVVKDIMSNAYYCDKFFRKTDSKRATEALLSYYYPYPTNLPSQDFFLAFGVPYKGKDIDTNNLDFGDFDWNYLIVEASISPNKQFALLDIPTTIIADMRKSATFAVSHVFASEHIKQSLKLNPQQDQWTATCRTKWQTQKVGWKLDDQWFEVTVTAPSGTVVPCCYDPSQQYGVWIVVCKKRLDQIKDFGV